MRLAALRAAADAPRAAIILQQDVYGWFERVERGVYTVSPAGRRGLEMFARLGAAPGGQSHDRCCNHRARGALSRPMRTLEIVHRTRYEYSAPVTLGEHRLMFRPRDSHDLRLLYTGLAIDPPPRCAGSTTRSATRSPSPNSTARPSCWS